MKVTSLLRSRLAVVAILTLLLSICVPSLMAQSAGTSGLTGTVTDPSGAAIPNVAVTITSNDTGQSRTANTGPDGIYKFTLLPPGNYKVRFAVMGFKTAEVASVTLNVTEVPTLDRTLEVGQQTEQVTVEASAELLQTQTSTLGTTVGEKVVTALPLSNRNYTQILGLTSGVSANVTNATTFGKATQDFSVNGADPGQNNYQMDGVAVNNIANGGSSNDAGIYAGIGIPNPDAIQEFKIQTSTYDASYGRNPGANVNVVTKSGSNAFHGGAWWFLRNEDLDANDFFENRDGAGKQQIFRQNQVGGNIGGPIKKDKIFFFADYQETRQLNGVAAQGSSTQYLPPLPSVRTAQTVGAALCPQNHPGDPNFNVFLTGVLPGIQLACDGSNVNPVALNWLNLKNKDGSYYVPSSGTNNFQFVKFSIPATYEEHQLVLNGDYLINQKNTLAMRYFYSNNPQTLPLAGGIPGTPAHAQYSTTDAVLKLTTLVSPTIVNEIRGSFQRNLATTTDTTPGTPQQIGMTPIIPNQTELPFTLFITGLTMGGGLNPSFSPTSQMQVADQVSWSLGRHNIRVGYEYEETQWNIVFAGLERGFLFFGSFNDWLIGRAGCALGDTTCSPGNPGNTNGGFGNILQCLFCVRSGPDGIIHGYRLPNQNAFVQDDWKVSPKLTVNIGVRWEYDGAFSDKYGNLTNFWTSQLNTVPVPPSGPTTSGPGLVGYVVPNNYPAHYGQPPAGVLVSGNNLPVRNGPPLTNFAPRIGFAQQVTDKLVIRGGFGIFYDRVAGDRVIHGVEQGYPYAVTLDYAGPGPATVPFSLQNPYPSIPLGVFASRWANFQTGQTSNLNTPVLSEDLHTPLTRQYNVSLQYQLAPSWVLELGYVGSSGINLVDTYQGQNTARLASPSNPINGITVNTTGNAALRAPILGYQPAGYQVTGFNGVSNYNSLQVTVRKQFSKGFTMQASYTWSKDLTDLSQANVNNISADSNVPEALNQQYGPSWFSHPNRFIVNYSYDLPFGQHKGLTGILANGWNVSGVTTIQQGVPLTIADTGAGTVYGLGNFVIARAQMCAGSTYGDVPTHGGVEDRLGGASGGPGYFNASAFCPAPAAPFSAPAFPGAALPTLFGNSGPSIVLGPGQFNFDVSILKTFRITERQTVQFRSEFFNIANHPQFLPPGSGAANPGALQVSSPTFGQITASSVNPRIIQFALKYIF